MKKFTFIIVLLLALFMNANAQLNYLFSATTKNYVPLVDGITPPLIMVAPANANPPWTLSDEGFAHVPIGFTFHYDGKNYDSATICANGFITLGDTISTRLRPLYLFENFLAKGPHGFYGVRPVLAPFWGDLDLVNTQNLVYKTTGHKPFRVFTVEWKKTKWTFESTQPALSMQLKLYEKTNVIEFHYRDEGGAPFTARAFASIGITSAYHQRGFISLQNASSNPPLSFLRAQDSITAKPANNQVYTFTPSEVNIPDPIYNIKYYTHNSVGFKLTGQGPGRFEYAISNSAIPPLSGIESKSGDVMITNLNPATTYYIYGRTIKNKNFYSQWTADSFKTAVNPVNLPYHVGGNADVYPYLPPELRIHNLYDTAGGHVPGSDGSWNVFIDFPEIADTSLLTAAALYGVDANEWVFTPGLNLTAGKTYQLRFSYLSYPSGFEGAISSFEVKYGQATGAVAMTGGTLFKRDDIVTDFNLAPTSFEDTTIEINPARSGTYYIGFHNLTLYDENGSGPVPIIRNIVVSEKSLSAKPLIVLTGKTKDADNILEWGIMNHEDVTDFEIQKSTDGINFEKIGAVVNNNFKKSNKRPSFKFNRITGTGETPDNGKLSIDVIKTRFELQKSEDGIHFKKMSASTSPTTNRSKIMFDHIDKNAQSINYYRLKQVNSKGKISYSNIVVLDNNQDLLTGYGVYPNPAKDVLNVRLPVGTNKKTTLLITDASGRIVWQNMVTDDRQTISIPINGWSGGMYMIVFKSGKDIKRIKFVKE